MISYYDSTSQLAPESYILDVFRDTTIYLHTYLEYADFKNNEYYFRSTNLLRYKEEHEDGCICSWNIIYASDSMVK